MANVKEVEKLIGDAEMVQLAGNMLTSKCTGPEKD